MDWLGDIWGGVTSGLGRAAGWVGEQVGGWFDGGDEAAYVAPSLGQPINLGARLAAETGGGSLWSRATDALGDVVEDVILPLGGAVLGQWAIGQLPGVGSTPSPRGGPATPLPSPTVVSYGATPRTVERMEVNMAGPALALPGGAAIARSVIPRALQALGIGAAGGAAVSLFDNGDTGMMEGRGTSPYLRTQAGVRPARHFVQVNPLTGKLDNFGYLGPCVLFSRDMSAHRKVNRLARKASRRGR